MRDADGGTSLTYDQFFKSLFELADLWVPNIDPQAYAKFIRAAFSRMTAEILQTKAGRTVRIAPGKKLQRAKLAATEDAPPATDDDEVRAHLFYTFASPTRSARIHLGLLLHKIYNASTRSSDSCPRRFRFQEG